MANPVLNFQGYFPNDSPSGKAVYYTCGKLHVVADIESFGEMTICQELRFPPHGGEIDTVDKVPAITKAGEMVLKYLSNMGICATILRPESSVDEPEGEATTDGDVI